MNTYVFPSAERVLISTTIELAETTGFEVRDIESFREHFVLTLRRWRQRLESNLSPINRTMDESTRRLWRLDLASAAHGVATGRLNLYQTLLSKTQDGATGMPLTHWLIRVPSSPPSRNSPIRLTRPYIHRPIVIFQHVRHPSRLPHSFRPRRIRSASIHNTVAG